MAIMGLYHEQRGLGMAFEVGQSLTTNHNRPHMMSSFVTCSSSGVQLQVIVDKCSLNLAKIWSWSDTQPKAATCTN